VSTVTLYTYLRPGDTSEYRIGVEQVQLGDSVYQPDEAVYLDVHSLRVGEQWSDSWRLIVQCPEVSIMTAYHGAMPQVGAPRHFGRLLIRGPLHHTFKIPASVTVDVKRKTQSGVHQTFYWFSPCRADDVFFRGYFTPKLRIGS